MKTCIFKKNFTRTRAPKLQILAASAHHTAIWQALHEPKAAVGQHKTQNRYFLVTYKKCKENPSCVHDFLGKAMDFHSYLSWTIRELFQHMFPIHLRYGPGFHYSFKGRQQTAHHSQTQRLKPNGHCCWEYPFQTSLKLIASSHCEPQTRYTCLLLKCAAASSSLMDSRGICLFAPWAFQDCRCTMDFSRGTTTQELFTSISSDLRQR